MVPIDSDILDQMRSTGYNIQEDLLPADLLEQTIEFSGK